ncbi:DUF2306 domain-containing protein [Agaribacter flavus]|uniref:DUF2306 domain-containing protein n=1 Tax=Agaribacter flavus TaxID=1902781 RepID=A0ABV7FR44_9ALTE
MSSHFFSHTSSVSPSANTYLKIAAISWGAVALMGQWAFAVYILTIYVIAQYRGLDISVFSPGQGAENTSGFSGFVFFLHILPAIIMAVSVIFQLLPNIRRRYPLLHRWNGRLFFVLGVSGAITGLYLTWGAGLRFSDIGAIGISVNGVLILIAIGFAWHTARHKRYAEHMRWAVHSFILVNAVWTFRLYLTAWFMVNQGSNGNSPNLDGPVDIFISFACYLLPMAIVELYFWAKRSKQMHAMLIAAAALSMGTLITLLGVISATLMMWMPRINRVIEAIS